MLSVKMAARLLVLVALIASVALTSADVVTKSDVARLKNSVLGFQDKNTGLFGDFKSTHQAVNSLVNLGLKNIPNSRALCKSLADALSKETDLEDIYYLSTSVVESLCEVAIEEETKQALQKGLKSNKLVPLHQAVVSILKLAGANRLNVNDFDFSGVVENVAQLMQADGTYSAAPLVVGHPYNAGLALEVLGSIFSGLPALEDSVRQQIRAASSKIEALMGHLKSSGSFTGIFDQGGLEVTATVLRGLSTLASSLSEDLDVTQEQFDRMTQFVMGQKLVGDLAGIFAFTTALEVLHDNHMYTPVALTLLEHPPLSTSVKVKLTNLFDEAVEASKVSLNKVVGQKELASNVALTASGNTYTADLAAAIRNLPSHGFATLQFTVVPKVAQGEAYKTQKFSFRVKFTSAITVESASIAVSESASSAKFDTVSFPSTLASTLSADSSKYFHLSFKTTSQDKNFRPHQAFVIFVNKATQAQGVFVPRFENGAYSLKLSLSSKDAVETLSGSGDYDVSIVIGDASASKPISWKLGQISLQINSAPKAAVVSRSAKPDQAHVFRTPDSRPSSLVSNVFTLFVLAPVAVLIYGLLNMGLNVQFPADSQQLIWTLSFQGVLAVMLFVLASYWIKLNIFQTLGALAVLACVAIVTGHEALKYVPARGARSKSD
eukprot:TRINITY_DN1009_c0_g1_i2.p1 TRINITY_DN1009_c0_g1~~TRINITY_DN1009_c0_g1_i2.p1  ORF type:complete len:664 (+),score=316.04 TRINITY_DN1009_c0_g1_i2:42-2033(+)